MRMHARAAQCACILEIKAVARTTVRVVPAVARTIVAAAAGRGRRNFHKVVPSTGLIEY